MARPVCAMLVFAATLSSASATCALARPESAMGVGAVRTLPLTVKTGNGNRANGMAIMPNDQVTTALVLTDTGCIVSVGLVSLEERQVACIGDGDPTAAAEICADLNRNPELNPPPHTATHCWMDNSIAIFPSGTKALVTDTRTHRVLTVDLVSGTVEVLAGQIPSPVEDVKTRCAKKTTLEQADLVTTSAVGTNAAFNYPKDIVISPDGTTAYVADMCTGYVRKIDIATASVSTIVVTMADGSAHDPAENMPSNLAMAKSGTHLLVTTFQKLPAVYKIKVGGSDEGQGTILAPTGERARTYYAADTEIDGEGTNGQFAGPKGIAVSSDGSIVLVADSWNHRVRMLNSTHVTTLAGTSEPADQIRSYVDNDAGDGNIPIIHQLLAGADVAYAGGDSVDSNTSTAQFKLPQRLSISPDGAFVLVNEGGLNGLRIIKIKDVSVLGECDCSAGKYFAINRTCADCDKGTYSLAGASVCDKCPVGAQSDVIAATSNSTCALCVAGKYGLTNGSSSCSICAADTTSFVVGATSVADCIQTTSSTPSNYFVKLMLAFPIAPAEFLAQSANYTNAIAAAAGVAQDKVTIISVVDRDVRRRRRLLAAGSAVDIEIGADSQASADRMKQELTVAKLNAELSKRGLANCELLTARIVKAPSSSSAIPAIVGSIVGVLFLGLGTAAILKYKTKVDTVKNDVSNDVSNDVEQQQFEEQQQLQLKIAALTPKPQSLKQVQQPHNLQQHLQPHSYNNRPYNPQPMMNSGLIQAHV